MRKYLLILSAAGVLVSCGGNGRRQASATDVGAGAAKSETVEVPGTVETTVGAGETVGETPDIHTAETSLDYLGTYEGTLPGADCPGIRTTIVLAADRSYTLHMEYLERDSAFDEKGTFKVEGNLLTLTPDDGENPGYYKVEENRLRHLDADRQPITGELAEHYVLQKK